MVRGKQGQVALRADEVMTVLGPSPASGSVAGAAWTSYLTSPSLSFLTVRTGSVAVPSSPDGQASIHAKHLEQTPQRARSQA